MPTQQAEEELLTSREVAALLSVSPKTVTRWAVAGKLTAIRTPGGHRRYLKSDVLIIVSGLRSGQVAPQPSTRQERIPEPHGATGPTLVPAQRAGGPRAPRRPTLDERQAAAAAVVAAAVAVALEVAAEAAAEVLVTAAAVNHKAHRAAGAAQTARGPREFAAAHTVVARGAVRTTTRVQIRGDVAAAQVEHAAAQAAEALLHSIEGGTVVEASELARLLAAAVMAAVETTAEPPQRGAATVANAATAAGSYVARAVAVAHHGLEDHDGAAAHALNHQAEATSAPVSHPAPHGGRAHPKSPLDVEAQGFLKDEREVALDPREACSSSDESAGSERKQRVRAILSRAEERDKQADRRDTAADHRDSEASLAWLLGDDNLGFSLQARRTAALDRSRSKEDRSLAACDRSEMAALEP